MSILYLVTIILGCALQNITKKSFSQTNAGNGTFSFALLASISAAIFFLVTSRDFVWDFGIVPYAVLFALSYSLAVVFSTYAMSCGSISLTALIVSYSLTIPTLYGLIFLNEPFSGGLLPGLVLLMISLFLINNKKNDTVIITKKWILYVFLAFIGNGVCSVAQKMQQNSFDGAYKNEFMIIALAMVIIMLLTVVVKKDIKTIREIPKSGWILAIICGIANGVVNLFVMILSGIIPVSLMFPSMSAGGIILTFFISKYLFREKLTKHQLIGFATGILSIISLNL